MRSRISPEGNHSDPRERRKYSLEAQCRVLARLFTVPYLSRKVVEIEHFALWAAILNAMSVKSSQDVGDDINPDVSPLGRAPVLVLKKTKMATRNDADTYFDTRLSMICASRAFLKNQVR